MISSQIREADAYTIDHEPIASIDLMERASKAFVGGFINHFPDRKQHIAVYCGTGNNGGDGLAIARMLKDHHFQRVEVKIARFSSRSSDEFNTNLQRLLTLGTAIAEIKAGDDLPKEDCSIIIDALLGTGLNKTLSSDYERLVNYLNSLHATVVAVDIPTGFFSEGETDPESPVLKADLVITFQQPKINFLLPESAPFIHCWEAVNIGINEGFIYSLNSAYQLVEERDIQKRLKPRRRFSNKGTYGHALIVAGQPETMGAALLSASGCVHAGAGLTTACIPQSGLSALNSYQPEIMAILRGDDRKPEIEWSKFSTIAVGPGLGKDENALALFVDLLKNYDKPIVVDADAINLLSTHHGLWKYVPAGSILTPHVKEFDRLFGEHKNWWQRLQTGMQMASEYKVYIILKNDYSISITPDGKCFFNSTGNAAMATGGMGDVLTGVLAALLAQNYSSEDACIIGNYIHGKAGDELALPNRMNVVVPGGLVHHLPATMAKLIA